MTFASGSMFFDALLSETPGGDSGFLAVYGLNILTDFLAFSADGSNDKLGVVFAPSQLSANIL